VLALQHFRSFTATGCDRQHGELSEINNMAKVFCVGFLIVEYDIQVDVLLRAFCDDKLDARLYLGILRNPLFHQWTGKMRCLDGARAAVGAVTDSPDVAGVETQYKCYG